MTDKFYEVGYADYDEESFVQLSHQQYIGNEDLERMVLQCVPEVWEKHQQEFEEMSDGDYAAASWATPEFVGEVVDVLCLRFGFRRITFASRFEVGNRMMLSDSVRGVESGKPMERLQAAARAAVPDWNERIARYNAATEKLFEDLEAEDE